MARRKSRTGAPIDRSRRKTGAQKKGDARANSGSLRLSGRPMTAPSTGDANAVRQPVTVPISSSVVPKEKNGLASKGANSYALENFIWPTIVSAAFFLIIQWFFEEMLSEGISRIFLTFATFLTFGAAFLSLRLSPVRWSRLTRFGLSTIAATLVLVVAVKAYPLTYPRIARPSLVILAPSAFSNSLIADRVADAISGLHRTVSTALGTLDVVVHEHNIRSGTKILGRPLIKHFLESENVFGAAVLYEHEGAFKVVALDPVDELMRKDQFSMTHSLYRETYATTTRSGVATDTTFGGFWSEERLLFYVTPEGKFPYFSWQWEAQTREDADDRSSALTFSSSDVQEGELNAFLNRYLDRSRFLYDHQYGDTKNACLPYLAVLEKLNTTTLGQSPYLDDLKLCASAGAERVAASYWRVIMNSAENAERRVQAANEYTRLVLINQIPIKEQPAWDQLPSDVVAASLVHEVRLAQKLRDSCGPIAFFEVPREPGLPQESNGLQRCLREHASELLGGEFRFDVWKEVLALVARSAVRDNDIDIFANTLSRSPDLCESLTFMVAVQSLGEGRLPSRAALASLVEAAREAKTLEAKQCFNLLRVLSFEGESVEKSNTMSFLDGLQSMIAQAENDFKGKTNRALRKVVEALRLFSNLVANKDASDIDTAHKLLESQLEMLRDIQKQWRAGLLENSENDRAADFGKYLVAVSQGSIERLELWKAAVASGREAEETKTPMDSIELPNFTKEYELRRLPMYWAIRILVMSGSDTRKNSERARQERDLFISRFTTWRYTKHVCVDVDWFLADWEHLVSCAGNSEEEFLKSARAHALAQLGRVGEARQAFVELAKGMTSLWDKDIYGGKAARVTDALSGRETCIGDFSRREVDALEELFFALEPSAVATDLEFRQVLAALRSAYESSKWISQSSVAAHARAYLDEAAKNPKAAQFFSEFSKNNPGVLSSGLRLIALWEYLWERKCEDEPDCKGLSLSEAVIEETGFAVRRLAQDGCERGPREILGQNIFVDVLDE